MRDPRKSVGWFRLAPAFLALTGVAAPTSRAATWTAVNSGLPAANVNVGAIVIAPAAPSTLYATARSLDGAGGVFKTTDGAASWKPLSTVAGVNSLVADPRNPSTIYVVSGRGLLKSVNGGDTWTGAGTGLPNTYVGALAIDPVTPSTLYALTGGPGAIYKSTNGGAGWNQLNTNLPPSTSINSLVIDPLTPSRIYAAGLMAPPFGPPNAVLVRSTDGGESWSVRDTGLPANSRINAIAIAPSSPSVIYASVFVAGASGSPSTAVLKSADGGESWSTVTGDLPRGASVLSLVIDPKSSSTIYFVVLFPFAEAGGILKSTDGGVTWKTLNTDLPANTPIQSLVIDPGNTSTIYMIVDGAIFKTTDGGAKWNKATSGLTTIDVQAVTTSRTDTGAIYAATGDSLFKSVDSGVIWSELFTFRLSASSAPTFIAPPFPVNAPAYPRSLLIDYTNPNILYATTSRGNGCFFADNLLFKTTDGGASWSDSISPDKSGCVLGGLFGPSAGLKAMDPTDPNTLYLAETDDEDGGYWLLRSRDGGATWSSIGSFPADVQGGVWALAIDPANPTTLYAGLDDVPQYSESGEPEPGLGGVFKSTDGGTTWNRAGLSGAAVKLLVIDPAHPNVLFATTEGNYGVPRGFRGLFKSTDGGATWSPANNGLEVLLDVGPSMTALVIDPADSNILYAATAGGGVFRSSDSGASWTRLNDGLANLNVRTLAVIPGARHGLLAGTAGGLFKIVDDTP